MRRYYTMKNVKETIIPTKSFHLRRTMETKYGKLTLDSIAEIWAPPGKELMIDVKTYVNHCKLLCFHCTDKLDTLYENSLDDDELMEYIALDYIKYPRGNFEETPEEMVETACQQFSRELRSMGKLFRMMHSEKRSKTE